MAQTTINNGDSGSTVRTALNSMFNELYALGTFTAWVPSFTGFSVNPTVNVARYVTLGKLCFCYFSLGNGTSDQTFFTMTLPFNALNNRCIGHAQVTDGGVIQTLTGLPVTRAGSNIMDVYRRLDGTAWSSSGSKTINQGFIIFERE